MSKTVWKSCTRSRNFLLKLVCAGCGRCASSLRGVLQCHKDNCPKDHKQDDKIGCLRPQTHHLPTLMSLFGSGFTSTVTRPDTVDCHHFVSFVITSPWKWKCWLERTCEVNIKASQRLNIKSTWQLVKIKSRVDLPRECQPSQSSVSQLASISSTVIILSSIQLVHVSVQYSQFGEVNINSSEVNIKPSQLIMVKCFMVGTWAGEFCP
eukprot:2134191-Amphidinium_carterae.1